MGDEGTQCRGCGVIPCECQPLGDVRPASLIPNSILEPVDPAIQIPPIQKQPVIDPDDPDRSAVPPDGTQVLDPVKEPQPEKPGFKPPPVKKVPEQLN